MNTTLTTPGSVLSGRTPNTRLCHFAQPSGREPRLQRPAPPPGSGLRTPAPSAPRPPLPSAARAPRGGRGSCRPPGPIAQPRQLERDDSVQRHRADRPNEQARRAWVVALIRGGVFLSVRQSARHREGPGRPAITGGPSLGGHHVQVIPLRDRLPGFIAPPRAAGALPLTRHGKLRGPSQPSSPDTPPSRRRRSTSRQGCPWTPGRSPASALEVVPVVAAGARGLAVGALAEAAGRPGRPGRLGHPGRPQGLALGHDQETVLMDRCIRWWCVPAAPVLSAERPAR
jgi:hypothetical protein